MRIKEYLKACALMLCAGQAQAAGDVMVVFDGSNSMWGQIDGTPKIEIAREAMQSLVGDWTEDTPVGLMAYGHRREGDCSDIETLVAPGPFDRESFMARVRAISPKGKTPLTAAVEQAAETLSYRDNPATVVLITDGIESCRRDPCALAGQLEQSGVGFTAHVVGFDLEGEELAAVACMAERTGGRFVAANNADELGSALSEVGMVVAEAPDPEPAPIPDVTLDVPGEVLTGAMFKVGWANPEQQSGDWVNIVPAGADEGSKSIDYVYAKDDTESKLQAPAEPGLYEIRYVRKEGRKTLASAEVEVIAAETSVSVPETAVAGSRFPISWTKIVNAGDWVNIVPAGSDEDSKSINYIYVKDDTEGELRAPAEPGLYEVRYVLKAGRKTLASAEIEVTAAEVSVSAPETAVVGSRFPINWTSVVNPGDWVNIVPLGAEEGGKSINYLYVKDDTEGELRAPAEPGLYEVRYVLKEGRKTVASTEIEVVEASVELSGPDIVRAGSPVQVSWSEVVNPGDWVGIVPAGADEGSKTIDYLYVKDDTEAELRAPDEAGIYEVRYILKEGRRTVARHMVEVVPEDATLSDGGTLEIPENAAPGQAVDVSWTSDREGGRQRVSLAAVDQADFSWIEAQPAKSNPLTFTLPAEPGSYEFRLLDLGERKVLSRAIIVVK